MQPTQDSQQTQRVPPGTQPGTQVDIAQLIADELKLRRPQVQATLELLDGGATVPFISRYRKEATGNLDEVQVKTIEERGAYLAELSARKQTILDSIGDQGKLMPELAAAIARTL